MSLQYFNYKTSLLMKNIDHYIHFSWVSKKFEFTIIFSIKKNNNKQTELIELVK